MDIKIQKIQAQTYIYVNGKSLTEDISVRDLKDVIQVLKYSLGKATGLVENLKMCYESK